MKHSRIRLKVLAWAGLALVLPGLLPLAAADGLAASKAHAALQDKLEQLAQQARPGLLSVAVLDLQSGAEWRVNADRACPMMSVFKAPLAATVLAGIDRGKISFEQPVLLTRADLRGGASAIRDNFHGNAMPFTVRQLLAAAVTHSDNTAADALVKFIGGPEAVTIFLRAHGIEGMQVGMDEGTVSHIFSGLGPSLQPPASETPEQRDQRLMRGYKAFLADPRNRSTPEAAVAFLRKLRRNELLSQASTQYLIGLMEQQTFPRRLRSGLPAGIRFADKTGTSGSFGAFTAAYNDIGILTWPDGRCVIVAAFLTASAAPEAERDAIFADLGREAAGIPAVSRPRPRN